jgi:hypothetical protein
MNRIESLHNMGQNCKIFGLAQFQAQEMIDKTATCVEESDAFWEGYFNGNATEPIKVNGIQDENHLS